MKWAVLSFDLTGATSKDYGTAHAVLEAFGFIAMSPYKEVALPNTVFMKEVYDHVSAEELRDLVKAVFTKVGLRPTRVFGGILEDWATVEVAHP